MRTPLHRSAPADDDELARRARRGDRRAHRELVRRAAPRAAELVGLLVGDTTETPELASLALAAAVADTGGFDDCLIRASVQVTSRWSEDEAGLARLVLLLTDVEGRTGDAVAALLGTTPGRVAELRAKGKGDAGLPASSARRCRGWSLVAAREHVTGAEREAADGHLALCRTCRAHLAERDRTQERLLARGAAVGGVLVADVIALTLPLVGEGAGVLGGLGGLGVFGGLGGLGGAALGKLGMAVIGAAAIAVGGTAAVTAVVEQGGQHPAPVVTHSGAPGVPAAGATGGTGTVGTSPQTSSANGSSTGTGTLSTTAPSTSGLLNLLPSTGLTAVLPQPTSLLGIPLPSLSASALPLPLPSASLLPLPLPSTSSLLPLPLPSSSSLLPLPLPSVSPLPIVSSVLSPLPTLSPPPLLP